jgi:hypothetical protein
LPHDEEFDNPADDVSQQHRRAGIPDDPCGAEEQSRPDCSTQGDKLDMAVFQSPPQRVNFHYVYFLLTPSSLFDSKLSALFFPHNFPGNFVI